MTTTDQTNHSPTTQTGVINDIHFDGKQSQHSPSTQLFSLLVLIAFPSFYASKAYYIFCPRSTTPSPPASSSGTIKNAWIRYLDSRMAEWKVISTLAGLLVGLSLTMYQIPQAVNDPFTYVFASLTQYRALAGLMYTAALVIYFENEYTHTASFAMIWWKTATGSNKNIWNTWVMLSLPAASIVWALLFYLLAILSFIFRRTTPSLETQSMPFVLNSILQIIIACLVLSDLVCFTCIWVTLKRYRERYYATQDEV